MRVRSFYCGFLGLRDDFDNERHVGVLRAAHNRAVKRVRACFLRRERNGLGAAGHDHRCGDAEIFRLDSMNAARSHELQRYRLTRMNGNLRGRE